MSWSIYSEKSHTLHWSFVPQRLYSGLTRPQLKDASYAQSFWVLFDPGSVGFSWRPRNFERFELLCCGHARIAGTKALARMRALRSIVNVALKRRPCNESETDLNTNIIEGNGQLIL
jgi:hypothetical protein